MANLLPPKPLKWAVFILVVVILADVTGLTTWVRDTVAGLTNKKG